MAINIFIPPLNPHRFYQKDLLPAVRFHREPFDKLSFRDWVRPSQLKVDYDQKAQYEQNICVQVHATVAANAIYLYVIDCGDNTLHSPTKVAYTQPGNTINGLDANTFQWQFKFADISGITDGRYYLEIQILGLNPEETSITYISEPIYLKQSWDDTILLRYNHNSNDLRKWIVWNPLYPQFEMRVEGIIKNITPISTSSEYNDASYNTKVLVDVPVRKWDMVIGGAHGVPEYIIDKVKEIVAVDNWKADRKAYVKDSGAQIEITEASIYPKQQGKLKIVEAYRDRAFIFADSTLQIALLPTPPYAVGVLILFSSSIFKPAISTPIVIADGTAQTAWITALNAGTFGGVFSIISGVLCYTNSDDEDFNGSTYAIYENKMTLTIDATTHQNFDVTLGGDSVVIDWGDTVLDLVAMPTPQTTPHIYGSSGTYTCDIWHNNLMNYFYTGGATTHAVVTSFSNTLSSAITQFIVQHQNTTTQDFDFFLPLRLSGISTFLYTDSNLTTITGNMFGGIGGYQALNFIVLQNNKLTDTEIDTLFNDFYNNTLFPPGGTFEINGQSPAAPPTGASSGTRAGLISNAWYLLTD